MNLSHHHRPGPAAGPGKTRSKTRVVVADAKPLSLLATAGVLFHHQFECVCARSIAAVDRALGLTENEIGSPERGNAARPVDVSPLVVASRTSLGAGEPTAAAADRGVGVLAERRYRTGGGEPAAVDLLIWDVGDDADGVLEHLGTIRRSVAHRDLPAILLAEPCWSGLERRTEALSAATHCLFKPIDTRTLVSLVEQLTWMPAVIGSHRSATAAGRSRGWVSLTN